MRGKYPSDIIRKCFEPSAVAHWKARARAPVLRTVDLCHAFCAVLYCAYCAQITSDWRYPPTCPNGVPRPALFPNVSHAKQAFKNHVGAVHEKLRKHNAYSPLLIVDEQSVKNTDTASHNSDEGWQEARKLRASSVYLDRQP